MKSFDILLALEGLEEAYILDARENTLNHREEPPGKHHSLPRRVVLIAAIVAMLSLCGFAAYEWGLFDLWIQKPSVSPTESVQSALEAQLQKEYTLTVRVDEVVIDRDETRRMVELYQGSDLAKSRGWTDDYLAHHFLAVKAKYYVEYDHTKTFLEDGMVEQYFYLTEDPENGKWIITDNSTNMHPD